MASIERFEQQYDTDEVNKTMSAGLQSDQELINIEGETASLSIDTVRIEQSNLATERKEETQQEEMKRDERDDYITIEEANKSVGGA